MSTTYSQEAAFRDTLIGNGLLEDAIAWIKKNMSPEDVFDQEKLESWATQNGYTTQENE
jgi:hypothetical protein